MKNFFPLIVCVTLTCFTSHSHAQVHKGMSSAELRTRQTKIMNTFGRYPAMFLPWRTQSERRVQLRSVVCTSGRVNLHFNEAIIQIPMREELCLAWADSVRRTLGADYREAKVGMLHNNIPIERYIPNVYRKKIAQDPARKTIFTAKSPLVRRVEGWEAPKGLFNKHIALWPSHGFYYEQKDSTWQLQRPHLFGTAEDLHTFFYADRYLIPMLESAGAVVVSPRERDKNPWEVIVDNDRPTMGASLTTGQEWRRMEGGFARPEKITGTVNPFSLGTYMTSDHQGGKAEYKFTLPEPGIYAVYVSYKPSINNSDRALYTINHAQGIAKFEVNQRIGGGWVYLGHFPFGDKGSVILSSDQQITTDAIKIGGGMGNTERGGKISDVPRWAEAARYFMQYSGVPHTVYIQDHQTTTESDYMDDYKSRGSWVNYIIDNQRIPIDATLAIHSNSGIVDSTFGTLMINYTDNGKNFACRDMADIIQSQVVQDLRATIRPDWTLRSLYDKSYAEVSRPRVPAVIIEMFSHQNFIDMNLALTPAFRFTINRAIYKGLLKFLAARYSIPYVVQPLPISTFGLTITDGSATLSWTPPIDTLEATAHPNAYYANGEKLHEAQLTIPLDDTLRSVKIRAANDGGLSYAANNSFDLVISPKNRSVKTLIIRDLDPKHSFDTLTSRDSQKRGITISPNTALEDDYSITGRQIDFKPTSEFVDNRNPGWGATSTELIFKGLQSWTTRELEQLTSDPKVTEGGYAILSSNGLNSDAQSFATVVVITNKNVANIEKTYRQLIGPKTNLTIITPPKQFAPTE